VRNAIERSIQEWINPVVERSVKIAVITTENIVKKVHLIIFILQTNYANWLQLF
jgi:hypothetical protein